MSWTHRMSADVISRHIGSYTVIEDFQKRTSSITGDFGAKLNLNHLLPRDCTEEMLDKIVSRLMVMA